MLRRFVGWCVLFGLLLLAVLAVTPARAVVLEWDPNPEPNVAGYRVYYGTASRSYTSTRDVYAPLTSATILDLQHGQRYFFAVTAFDADGLESDYSDEVWIDLPNAAPVAIGSSLQTFQYQSTALVLSGIDLDGDGLQFSIVSPPAHGILIGASPNLTYSPDPDFSGTDSFQFVVSDGYASSAPATVFIVVAPGVNTPPTLHEIADISINEDSGLTPVLLSGIGSGAVTELQPLSVSAISDNPAVVPDPAVDYASPQSAGTLFIKPALNASGAANITVTVTDGYSTATRVFTVVVNAVNDRPRFDAITNLDVDEDSGAVQVLITGINSGAIDEAQPLTVSAISGNTNIISRPIVTYRSPETTATLTFAPLPNAFGRVPVRVLVSDGLATVARFFIITVNPVDDPPTLDPIADVNVDARTSSLVALTGISAGPSNELQTLSLMAVSDNPAVVPDPVISYSSPSSFGSLTIAPIGNSGTANISVTISDGTTSVTRVFNVAVNATNHAPIVDAGPDQSVALWTPVALLGTAMDDGMPRHPGVLAFEWSQISGPGAALLSTHDALACGVTFPQAGEYVFRLFAYDGMASASDEVRITVTNGGVAPIIADFSALAIDARTIAVTFTCDKPASSTVSLSSMAGVEITNVTTTFSLQHLLVLTNLQPDTSYNVDVVCSDADGMTSTTNAFAIATPPVMKIVADIKKSLAVYPMLFGYDLSAGYYLVSLSNEVGTAAFNFPVSIQSGYRIWCHVQVPASAAGSFYVSDDRGPEFIFDIDGNDSAGEWRWVCVRDISDATLGAIPRIWWLTPDVHRFAFRSRAAGTKLSGVHITNDPDWVPR